jgi:hypothetical protein
MLARPCRFDDFDLEILIVKFPMQFVPLGQKATLFGVPIVDNSC